MPNLAPASSSTKDGIVLLVDDDPAVRGYCKLVLELNGWQVLAADGAQTACGLASEHGEAIRLLVTDVVMPGMNGRELADQLWGLWPELKVLFLSGYHADELLREGVAADRFHFLGKPFAPATLVAKVQEVTAKKTCV